MENKRREWHIKAEDIYVATACVQNWLKAGVMPDDRSYSITENPERPGYFIAEEH